MNDTATSVELDSVPSTQVDASNALRGVYRGRLFRKYLLLILTLVSIALLASGGISLYFTYEETKSALASLQHEKALAAASRIEQYIRQIERQITSAALPQLDASDVEARRIEFLKALRQAPEITDIAEVDAAGREQIAVSRLGMDSLRSNKDRSQDPAFLNARRGQPFFSPVYFRKETEPYMTIGVRSAGDKGPVTIADVNLKFVWDVVSRIKIGESGKAYVVDANGFLVADPDIGLVLRKTNLSELPHVQAAKQRGAGNDELAMLSRDIGGTAVLASLAPIESLNWNVFVEQPVAEVYRKLNASISRTGVLLLAGLFLSALGAWALARGMVRPIRTLEEGAQRIGAGDLDQAIDIKTGDELESLADGFNRMSSRLKESYAGLERKVEERTRALQNSLEQQTAISEILRVISSSPTDVQPVLDAVAERAAHLCNAQISGVLVVEDDMLREGALFAADQQSAIVSLRPVPLRRTSITGRAILDGETLHYPDILPLLESEYPDAQDNIEIQRARAVLAVPLIRESGAYGGIILYRREPQPFSADEIALVKTFADQAAIAIDNVRLFNETKRALEQQTAISEILRVISSSPTDVQPVLDAVAERAAHLCEAPIARVLVIDGDVLRPRAQYTTSGEALPIVTPTLLKRTSMNGRAALDRKTVHVADVVPILDTEFPDGKENALRQGIRSVLAVPLVREGGAYGTILLWRREVKPFTPDQIALVETFARQAAIAIDNVRLFNETKEALEQQTAISEILRVISGSPTDVQPVFDIIGERAEKLCDAQVSFVTRVDGDVIRLAAVHGVYERAAEFISRAFPMNVSAETVTARTVRERTVQHVTDVLDDPVYQHKELATLSGYRAALGVPMLRDGAVIGAIFVGRREPGRFSDSQVALLKTFADQAAIAIQNVRLFNETKEALEQQTAVAEILRVISSSPTDVRPVLDAIAERVARLCDASSASMYLTDGDQLRHLASKGPAAEPVTHVDTFPINRESISGHAILDQTTVHIADMLAVADQYPLSAELAKRYGHRAAVVMPLFREGKPFGTIVLRRLDVRPFGERELALLRTFGDQAAIALENTRLFNETKEALEQQRASGEVLTAISNSIADSKPVFDVILASCQRLFEGDIVGITLLREDGMLDVGANAGRQFEELKKIFPQPLSRDSASGIAILDRKVLAFADIESDDMPPRSRDGCRSIGTQSMAFAPMVFEGRGIGTLWIGRSFKGAFTEKQLTLLKTFAEQAVIAIQNARLFNETKEALDQQRASGEILSAISNSIADTAPVFEKILQSCERLFEGRLVQINLVGDDGLIHLGAYHGPGRETIEKLYPVRLDDTTSTGVTIMTRSIGHFPDVENGSNVPVLARRAWQAMGINAAITAPMLWEGRGIGSVVVGRDYAGSFSEKEIALLKTFADQAVIAIQNARLFNETKEALEQQRASGDVLAAISNSIADTSPVFETILASCERLFVGKIAVIDLIGDDGLVHLGGYHGPHRDEVERVYPHTVDMTSATGTAIATRAVVHYANWDDAPEGAQRAFEVFGIQAAIGAPMMWEGKGIGAIWVARDYAGPFSEKEIALLKTFADQAVIAIQNARLFNETKEALDQQRASAEVLATISSSIADTAPVFDKILESCERLFVGTMVGINLVGEDNLIHLGAYHGPRREELETIFPTTVSEESGSGTAIVRRTVLHIPDVDAEGTPPNVRRGGHATGIRSIIFAPMLWEGKGIGAIFVGRTTVGPFSEKDIALLKTFADQAVIAIQNARLFREIQDKSRQLEVANKHKSDFLANMSHELRTPLNAIIGFSEVMLERFFGDVNEKQEDYLKDIHSSGKHLLSLINDILDLSKVEAGRMELEPTSFDVSSALSNAMTLIRERAQRHGIAIGQDVDPMLGEIVADERKFKQILLNLLTNAVKFTPDGGQINVSARKEDSQAVIAVRDTGIGIAPEDQAAVFEEFRQVGHDYTRKQEGTGLGLALTRKFVELHGGKIWVESEPGEGSTFTFTIPLRPDKVALH